MFFASTNILRQKRAVGLRLPFFSINDALKKLSSGYRKITSSIPHRTFSEPQFEKLIKFQIELIAIFLEKLLLSVSEELDCHKNSKI